MQVEIAMRGRQADDFDALDQFLACPPVANERFVVQIFSLCRRASLTSSGKRAIDPSSLMISQMTAMGRRPASLARSTAASVWPARWSTPPGLARRGKTCPGCTKSFGNAVGSGHHGWSAPVGGADACGHFLAASTLT